MSEMKNVFFFSFKSIIQTLIHETHGYINDPIHYKTPGKNHFAFKIQKHVKGISLYKICSAICFIRK